LTGHSRLEWLGRHVPDHRCPTESKPNAVSALIDVTASFTPLPTVRATLEIFAVSARASSRKSFFGTIAAAAVLRTLIFKLLSDVAGMEPAGCGGGG
jgi:hypothetical protein